MKALNIGDKTNDANLSDDHVEGHYYKLNFQCTHNIAEYEILLWGLQLLKTLGAKRIFVQGYSELIIKKIKGENAAKHHRLRNYTNVVLDFLRTFEEYDISFIQRNHNVLANGLDFLASTCQMPHINKQYIVKIKHRPVVLIIWDIRRYLEVISSLKTFCNIKRSMKTIA